MTEQISLKLIAGKTLKSISILYAFEESVDCYLLSSKLNP